MCPPAPPVAPPPLLFVMAYHGDREADRFQRILDRWDDLVETARPFRFLFVTGTGRILRTRFDHSLFEHRDDPAMEKFRRVSAEWAAVARFVEEGAGCAQWFWWEHDVLPVRRDAFDFLLAKWTPGTKILGYRVRDDRWGMRRRINGVAFYARDYWSFVEPSFSLAGTFDTRREFRDDERGLFVEANDWYALVHHEGRLLLTPDLRLVHGVRDDSLLDQLLTGRGPYPTVPAWFRRARNAARVLRQDLRGYRRYPPEG